MQSSDEANVTDLQAHVGSSCHLHRARTREKMCCCLAWARKRIRTRAPAGNTPGMESQGYRAARCCVRCKNSIGP
jgi:hypothetical protein